MFTRRRWMLPASLLTVPCAGHPFLPDGDGSAGTGGTGGGGASGGEGGAGGTSGGSGTGDGAKPNGPNGFPTETPVAQMTAEQQAAYWKHYARVHEQTAKDRGDYDKIRAERDRLRSQSMTEQERAVEAARDEARKAGEAEAALKFGAQLVAAKFEALLAPRGLDAERVATLTQHLATGQFLKDDGGVNVEALTAFADAVAPAPGTGNGGGQGTGQGGGGQRWPSFGQGQRQAPPASAAAAGDAEADRRFGKPKTA